MKKLFVHYVLSFLIIAAVAFTIHSYLTDYFISKLNHRYEQENVTLFKILTHRLSMEPESEWRNTIKLWQDNQGTPLYITSLHALYLNEKEIERFKKNGFIAKQNWFSKHYGNTYITSSTYYLPIQSTTKILEIEIFKPQVLARHDQFWIIKPILLSLKHMSKNLWPEFLQQITEQTPNGSYWIEPSSKIAQLNVKDKERLTKRNFVAIYSPDGNENVVTYNRFNYDGKFYYLAYRWHRTFEREYHTTLNWSILIAALLCAIFIWVYPLHRALRKLKRSANRYAKGDFSNPPQLSKSSIMYGLAENLTSMAGRIQSLIQTNKDISYGLSHEVKTPLSRMHFLLDKADKTDDQEKKHQVIEMIRDDIDEVQDLINRVLQFANLERTEQHFSFKNEMLYPFLIECLTQWQSKLNVQGINFNYTITIPKNLTLFCHTAYLELMISNLIANAQKYGKGTIYVSAQLDQKDLILSVENSGEPISEEDKQKIFKPFSRLENTQNIQGHGIGLNFVAKVIELHHGKVEIQQSSLGGAKFTVRLPL